MYNSIGDQDAQMLAQIKALPEGDMKSSLFETFLKTMKAGQRYKRVLKLFAGKKINHCF
jgi:hypothetical protein